MTSQPSVPVAVVGIGASAGGLQAYIELLECLPPDTGMAFVIVQHLAAEHESLLATLLSRATQMKVIEVRDEPHIEPNCIYVIPPNRTMLVLDGKLSLIDRAPGIPRAVDIFLSALAHSHGHRSIGVVLSGTGNDGTMGIQAIKAAGGITFAQDSTALHSGMPQNAIHSGCVDFVLSAGDIAAEIARLSGAPDLVFGPPQSQEVDRIDEVLDVVRQTLSVDFSQYKVNTLHRRIRRRMALQKMENVDDYLALLLADPQEVNALYQDILISVTNFFRNPESFETLKATVFPRLFAREPSDEAIRVWVLGCSTGEEAYSLAIALQEYMDEIKKPLPLTVFGTDINGMAIERARRAWYPKSIAHDISQARLERFFTEIDGGYCVVKAIRERCIFARHNALTDPPFSNMDLVSCRNMLIYLQSGLQRKLLPLLHYALKSTGVLFLGPSETISHYRDLFDVEDARHKLYTKRPSQRRVDATFSVASSGALSAVHSARKSGLISRETTADTQREAERILLKHYAPAGVLINADGEVLQFRGETSPFLTPSEGKASLNLLKMAREGLLAPVRAALQSAQQMEGSVRSEGVVFKGNDDLLTVSLNVIPVSYAPPAPRCYWVLFEPQDLTLISARKTRSRRLGSKSRQIDETERQIHMLSQELAATREYLQATIESQEASNEELQSANEEVQSANEELQSTNEELETSKEEIQSSNEELTTVNEELRVRNNELDRANDDLNNLFSSIQMAVVMLWPDLRIRRFTPLAQKAFNIRQADLGRSICDMNLNLDIANFPQFLSAAVNHGLDQETEVRSQDGCSYLLRIRPYRTQGNKLDGAIIVLIDIDTLAQTQENLRKRVAELAVADRHKNEFLAILAHELRNPLAPLRNAAQILRLSPADAEVSTKARELIERQVRHMSRLVSDLLDAARAQHGQIQLQRERLDLREVVERSVDVMRPQFEARKQNLQVQLAVDPVWIDGDSTRLEQIVSNLLNNANKYTGENGTIEVSVGMSDPQGPEKPEAIVRISDTGEGIDPELLPRLFDLFSQADRSLAHSQGGLGIGLSLVRTFAELHGGKISAYSEGRNRGSEFLLRLPLRNAKQSDIQDEESVPLNGSAPRPQRVLIVDDNPDIRESTGLMLSLVGHEVKAAASGLQALEMAVHFQPTAILLDIGLPDLSGYEVARRLRQMSAFAAARIIAVSGYDTPQAREQALEAGCDHHVSKPVTLSDLENLLSA